MSNALHFCNDQPPTARLVSFPIMPRSDAEYVKVTERGQEFRREKGLSRILLVQCIHDIHKLFAFFS